MKEHAALVTSGQSEHIIPGGLLVDSQAGMTSTRKAPGVVAWENSPIAYLCIRLQENLRNKSANLVCEMNERVLLVFDDSKTRWASNEQIPSQ